MNMEDGSHELESVSHDRRILVGFWTAITFAVVLAVASLGAMRAVVRSLSTIAFEDTSDMIAVQRLREDVLATGREARGYLVSGDASRLSGLQAARQSFSERYCSVQRLMTTPGESEKLARIERAHIDHQAALDRVVAMRRGAVDPRDIALAYQVDVLPARDDVNQAVLDLMALQESRLHAATLEAKDTITRALVALVALAIFALLLAIALGIQLTRSLRALRERRQAAARHSAEVEALNGELDAFAGRVSHDIRNLLAPIALSASLLPREIGKPDRVRVLTERIQRGIDRALAIMNGLLAFSRSGTPDPGAVCSIAAVVNESLEQLSPLAAQVDAALERRVDDVDVVCSRELLNVIILNVVGNALKFMEGRERRSLSISARAVGDSCELAVADTGPGIPQPALGHIFEPFYRVPGNRQPGAGLGLATVARIVSAHGGRLDVESKLGEGTTFRIRLPVVRRTDSSGHAA